MKMNDICIITIYDESNYGNRLQNYALHTLLSRYGNVRTANILLERDNRPLLQQCLKRVIKNALKIGAIVIPEKFYSSRRARFTRFSYKHIPSNTFPVSIQRFVKKNKAIGFQIVIGSDQVWNYSLGFSGGDIELFLGMNFPSPGLVSYAASVGVSEITDKWRPLFCKGWQRIKNISVREDRAAKLVAEIASRDAAVVLDPTLMLAAEQWAEVFTGFVPEGERYVLTYFLGRPTKAQEAVIQGYASKSGLRVRRVNDKRDRETYAAGPAEFAELFAKASYVFTDSYHACCFSILNNVPFKVFNRQGFSGKANMNSRMQTLFRLFELDDLMGDDAELPKYDWPRVNALLGERRAESRTWLEKALEVGSWQRKATGIDG